MRQPMICCIIVSKIFLYLNRKTMTTGGQKSNGNGGNLLTDFPCKKLARNIGNDNHVIATDCYKVARWH